MTRVPRRRRFTRDRAVHRARGARDVAFAVLSQYKGTGRFVSRLLDAVLAQSPNFPLEERPLAVEMINGVVRRQATLDAIIASQVTRPRHRIEGELWTLLQLGTYQLIFLESIPAYAAVNESVALANTVAGRRWDGFVNGVLRSVQRLLKDEFSPAPTPDAVPIAAGRYRRLGADCFPDPAADPVGYVATAFSFPRWLVERWHRRVELADLCRLGFWFDRPPPMALRVNVLKTTRDDVLASLREHGLDAAPGALSESIRLPHTLRVDSIQGFRAGLFSVQDESAMQAVELLNPQTGETIWDVCAAPGVKTSHIAERMRDTGTLVATDIRPERLARIDENSGRLGLSVIRTSLIRPEMPSWPDGPFDAILVDVPCSNTGVLSKRPEARWRINPAEIAELVVRQETLLETACVRLKPGGRLVYSTCSIEPEENEEVVASILRTHGDMALIRELHHIPGRPADGGYQALLQRLRVMSRVTSLGS